MSTLVSTEMLKIRTTRSWWALLLALLVLTSALTLLTAFTAGVEFTPGQSSPSPDEPAVARSTYTTGFGMAYVFALVLGILGVSTEYRHQTVTPTFLATPRRPRVVIAKMLSVSAFAVLYVVLALAVSVGIGATVFAARGYQVDLLGDDVPRSLALSVVGTVAWALIGTGLATLIRNQVAAIATSIGFVFILEPLIVFGLSFLSWGENVTKFFPGSATTSLLAVSFTGGEPAEGTLVWWAGLLVLLAYSAVFAGLGAALTLRRDIT